MLDWTQGTLTLLYYLFSGGLLLSAFMVIYSANPVHSVLFLILVFCGASGLLLLLEAEFLAMLFLVVYVGAIAVLFIFVVMMLNIKVHKMQEELLRFVPIGSFIALVFFLELFFLLGGDFLPQWSQRLWISGSKEMVQAPQWFQQMDGLTNLQCFGQLLYTHYFYYFLAAGLILLVALLGTIVLTLQTHRKVKRQQLFQQLSRNFENAIFLVK